MKGCYDLSSNERPSESIIDVDETSAVFNGVLKQPDFIVDRTLESAAPLLTSTSCDDRNRKLVPSGENGLAGIV